MVRAAGSENQFPTGRSQRLLSTLQLEWKEREEAGQAEFQRELQKQKDAGVRAVRPAAGCGCARGISWHIGRWICGNYHWCLRGT